MLFRKAARAANPVQTSSPCKEKEFVPAGTQFTPGRILLENTRNPSIP
jgi:hypothetical protein